jgi:hypothetical protein
MVVGKRIRKILLSLDEKKIIAPKKKKTLLNILCQ